jgi:signal transduction histidine kinase/streptogramin lyase
MKPKFLLVILGLFGCCSALCQQVHFTPVAPPKEEPFTSVVGMSQDPQGYLWIVSFNGLYKYDGHQYTLYQHDPSDPNSLAVNRVESVYADKKGIIWIGTFGTGLDRLDPVTNKFTHYRHKAKNANSLGNDIVTCITGDADGTLLLGTYSGLDIFDPKSGIFKHFSHRDNDTGSLSNNQVRVVYRNKQGTIWVGTGSPFNSETPKGDGGLNKLDKKTGKFTRYLHNANDPHSLINNWVGAIFEDSRGTFWVGTAGDGLHVMDRKSGTFQRYLNDPAHPEKLSRPPLKNTINYGDDHITFINEDMSGKIWIGTFEGGINVYDPKNKKTEWYGSGADNGRKLPLNEFWFSYKTKDSILWIAPWLSNTIYKIIPYQNKMPYNYFGKRVFAFAEDSAKSLWIATAKGLVHEQSDNAIQTFNIDKNSSSEKNSVHYLEKDGEETLWLASYHGLYKFNTGTKTFINYHHQQENINSLVSDSVVYLKKGADNKLWIGTGQGLDLLDTKTGVFKHYRNNANNIASISNDRIEVIEIDKNNDTWVGTDNGIDRLDKKTDRFKRYLNNNATVHCLLSDSRGNLWAATDIGLFKYDKQKDNFVIFGTERIDAVWIAEDHEKNLWLSTLKGIVKLNLKTNESTAFGKSQGVNGTFLMTYGYTRRNGEVLFGDTGGYFSFKPAKLLHRAPAPATIIDKFFLDNIEVFPSKKGVLKQPMTATTEIRLKYNQDNFSFGYTSIDFVSEEGDSRILYILENYDKQWRKSAFDETANYYNVPPGNYTFKVKSVNTNGLTTEKSIDIIISPPWWTSWWAYVLFAFAITGSIWLLIWYRSLSLLRDKRVLEQKVQLRTEEVLQQKEEIEAQRDHLEHALDELKTAQTQLIQSEKLASLGELTAGIAHEIQNPLNFVNNFAEVSAELTIELASELKNGNTEDAIAIATDIEQNLGKIRHHGKRADSIVKGMLEHSRSNPGERQPTNINKLADEYIKLSYHGMRAKYKSLNAELVINLDENLPLVNAVQQDLSRVMLNLFNNAFYAVYLKKEKAGDDYKPEVSVSTKADLDYVFIKVRDNGTGIPDNIKDKIMQPFFTTKPTGEGTGLGLSLSYDIIVKGHNGKIDINSKEGEYTEIVISLPI